MALAQIKLPNEVPKLPTPKKLTALQAEQSREIRLALNHSRTRVRVRAWAHAALRAMAGTAFETAHKTGGPNIVCSNRAEELLDAFRVF